MTEEKKKELFPYFAYLYSKQLNPEKYGNIEDLDTWSKTIQDSPKDLEAIVKAASDLTDDDWSNLENEYMKASGNYNEEDYQTMMACKGAKLQKLRSMKKGKKMTKKCSCGCDMVSSKEKGGKLVYKCSCGCGAKK